MNRNLSVYLTKNQKQFIERLIDIHLDTIKTNPYYDICAPTFISILNKFQYNKSIYLSRFEKQIMFNMVRKSVSSGVAHTLLPQIKPFTDKLMKKLKYD
jgi:hypothetical protein